MDDRFDRRPAIDIYAHGSRLLKSAVTRMHLEPTLHEGLFVACVDYLQWIDVDRDLPLKVAVHFQQWSDGLLPEPRIGDGYDFILSTVRQLDLQDVREKVSGLERIAATLQTSTFRRG